MNNSGENCLTEVLLLRALDEELPRRQAWQVKLHIESCESCQARLDEMRLVSSRVAELHDGALPPDEGLRFAAQLEEESRKRDWARRHWFTPIRPTWWQLASCGAFAVAIVAGLGVWSTHPGATARQIVRPLLHPVAPPAPRQLVAGIPAQPVRRTHHIVRKHVPLKHSSSPAQVAVREVATPFFDLPFSDSALPLDQATVIRVELPRSALELAGLPVEEDRRNQRIRADLVVGADGLARAIRFVE
jgi:hypothetical protein